VHPTLNDHECNMRPACVVHAVWRHFVPEPSISRLLTVDFILFFSLFYFTFLFLFLFLEQLGLGFISHAVTSVTNWWRSHKTDHRTWENGVKGSGTNGCHTVWTTHAGLMLYSWSFRVGCTVVSMDHGE